MEERIKYLFRQYLNNSCTRKEFEEFFSYINEAGHNELIRELIKKAYEETGLSDPSSFTYVNESGRLVLTEPALHGQQAAGVRPQKRSPRLVVVTACVAMLIAGFGWFIFSTVQQKQKNKKQPLAANVTGRSENKYMLLPDSTQVWLNAASTIEYPQTFGTNKREVFLTGEAYFDVKHADKQPFLIHSGKVTIRVLGTAFNIKAYPGREHVVVSVSRGKVQVNYDEKEVATLIQGQQIKVIDAYKPVVQKHITASEAAPWQQGKLVYDDERISDIVADLERIYDVTIRMQNETLAGERISTSFRREIGIGRALQVLCNLTDTRLKLVNEMYVIE